MIDLYDSEYTVPGELLLPTPKPVEAWPEKADRRIMEMTVHRLINAADQVQIDGVQRSIDGNS